jgi:homoserine O-acetyltransferase
VTAATASPSAAGLCRLPGVLELERGGRLAGPVLAFERQGPPDAPVVAVLGGISAGRHVASHLAAPGPGWWEGAVGPGLGIDTRSVQVLAFDWLGGAGSSTGPAGVGPDPFPDLTPGDQAAALALLLDHLGIPRLRALVGASYGGMVGLQFAARSPARLERLCVLAAAHEPHPMATAFRCLQRRIVALGTDGGRESEGVALARALAMATYRGRPEFAERFAPAPAAPRGELPVQQYLLHRGREFAARFPAAAYLCLSTSIDLHRVDPARVPVPTWLVGFDSDQVVPPEQIAALARALPCLRRTRVIDTPYGHDGFLKEAARLLPLLREVLS